MFRLDDQFLKEIGLDALPEEQKKPFLKHIYDELELRVGMRLSDGLTEVQLDEFEQIIDRKEEKLSQWLGQYVPNYTQDPAFLKLQQASELPVNDLSLIGEFTATKWLEVNRPDYRDVVVGVLNELKQEIIGNRDAFLGGIQAQQAQQMSADPTQQPPAAS